MASPRALAHALALVGLAAGEYKPFYLQVSPYSDSSCTSASTEDPATVYNINNLGPGSPFGELQGMATGCVASGEVFVNIEDCMINVYTASDCTGTPVAVQPLGPSELGGCTYDGDQYYSTTCLTAVPPASEARDLTCWDVLPTEELLDDAWPQCSEMCQAQDEPTTCEAGLAMIGQCAVGCSESDLGMIEMQLQFLFGCSCEIEMHIHGGSNGTSMHTCGDIKDAYKRNGCCGNPHKHFEMHEDSHDHDADRRRLAKRFMPWPRRSPPKVSTPRGLPDVNKKDARDAAFAHSVARKLARARSRGGARHARSVAAEIGAVLGSYLSRGAVQV